MRRLATIIATLLLAAASAPAASAAPGDPAILVSGQVVGGGLVTLSPIDFPDSGWCTWRLSYDSFVTDVGEYESGLTTTIARSCGDWTLRLPASASGTWVVEAHTADDAGATIDATLALVGEAGTDGPYSSTIPTVRLSGPHTVLKGETVTETLVGTTDLLVDPAADEGWTVSGSDGTAIDGGTAAADGRSFSLLVPSAGSYEFRLDAETASGDRLGAWSLVRALLPDLLIVVPPSGTTIKPLAVTASLPGAAGTLTFRWWVDGKPAFAGSTGHLSLPAGTHVVGVVATTARGATVARSRTVAITR